MDKMKMESPNLTERNIEKIASLFPNCITETADENGRLKKAVNFEILRAMLGETEGDESYEFTWVGKKSAIAEANTPIRKTLRPCPEESVNWDTTENLYIEGDNLEVLKLLQESYLGKVKMIYIDPPYNTGNDFIYRDDFAIKSEVWKAESGEINEDGSRLFKNTDANGRFHSDWCSMMYARLLLARNLLSDDGVIFISIDEHELVNLVKIADNIFGDSNKIGILSVVNNLKGRSDDKFFATCNEFALAYAKRKDCFSMGGFELEDEEMENDYDFCDEIGYYKLIGFRKTGNAWKREERPYMFYPVLLKDGNFSTIHSEELKLLYDKNTGTFHDDALESICEKYHADGYTVILPKTENGEFGRWRWGLDTFYREKDFNLGLNRAGTLCTKMRACLEDGSIRLKSAKTLWYKPEYDTGSSAKILKQLFAQDSLFDNPKSIVYLRDLIKISALPDSIILDFFSGSATTAHAVMQLNAEDGGKRKFIMVQLPEACNETSDAYKAGYQTICEIGKERIRRAGKKIQNEVNNTTLDTGFRVFKLDETNMEDVYYNPAQTTQKMLEGFEQNIKSDRTDLDLLFGCLLEWGLSLSMPYHSEQVDGSNVHIYNNGDLIACFDKNISENVVKSIAKQQPLRVVFRDDSFADSPSKINVSEIFKMISPDTSIKVI